jgi:putative Mg2+ transporter-C (MgtC) family protein
MAWTTFLFHSLLALALGSFIGLERQWHRRLADMKTNALVSLGAALFMMTTVIGSGYQEPIRMAAQIVVGVGFIGGGLLFRDGTQTRGINTAATLWCSAAVGTLCGLGQTAEASMAATILVIANTLLRDVAKRLELRMGLGDVLTEHLTFEVECDPAYAVSVRNSLEQALQQRHGELRSVSEIRTMEANTKIIATATFEGVDILVDVDAILLASQQWNVVSVSWRRQ